MPEKTVYCTKDDVQKLIKRIQFSEITKVTISDVNAYIDFVCGNIDGELRKLGITLPLNENVSPISMGILKNLAMLGVASLSESSVWGASTNKGESNYAEILQDKYDKLLESIQNNPSMLSDVVASSTNRMKSDTEDMNVGEKDEGDETFTKKRIKDFKDANRILSPSEKESPGGISGRVDRTRI